MKKLSKMERERAVGMIYVGTSENGRQKRMKIEHLKVDLCVKSLYLKSNKK